MDSGTFISLSGPVTASQRGMSYFGGVLDLSHPSSPFEQGLKMMGAQQQLAARSLINLIEMISTSSHRYAQDTSAFTKEAVELMNAAALSKDPLNLTRLQQQWADTCLKYGQSQTRATMAFVEQCGLQALNVAAHVDDKAPPAGTPPAETQTKAAARKTKPKKD